MLNYIKCSIAKLKSPRFKDVFQLTLPVITEQTFVILMGAVNVIMAGRIGKEAAAAIGMVDTLNTIFIAVFSALAVGSTVIVAFFTGQNNYRKANESAKQSLYAGFFLATFFAVLIGIFNYPLMAFLYGSAEKNVLNYATIYLSITLFTYPFIALTSIACGVLRGAGDTKNPATVVILMNIINIISSYLLIFGLKVGSVTLFHGLGIVGAALGIGIARIIGTLVLIYILTHGTLNVQVDRLFSYKPQPELLKKILYIGVPGGIETLLFNTGKLVTQTFIVALGTVSIVANYIGMTVHGMMVIPGNALSVAGVTLVGQSIGRGEPDGAEEWMWYVNKLAIILMVAINFICFPFFSFITSLFTPNQEIVRLSTQLLQVTAFFVVAWSPSFLIPAGLKGTGDVKYTLILSTFSMWLFRVTLGYVLCVQFHFGVLGIWFGMYLDWLIRATAFTLRLKKGKWRRFLNSTMNQSPTN